MMKGIFVMGDLNDRYDAITDFNFNGQTVKYKGTAPKSCCHNWDSSCPEANVEKDFSDGYKTCSVPAKVWDSETGKLPLSDGRELIENYKYAGDKVFGSYPESVMEIFEADKRKGRSVESDHELVFATFGDSAEGGRRRKTRSKRKSKAKSKRRH
jgi:hypothetical protein